MNNEFENYLNDRTKLEKNDSILEYWSKQQHIYPTLYAIAKDILIIPATNTSIERLFSASGSAVTETRTRLDAEKLNKLMFLKKNHLMLKSIGHITSSKRIT